MTTLYSVLTGIKWTSQCLDMMCNIWLNLKHLNKSDILNNVVCYFKNISKVGQVVVGYDLSGKNKYT